MAVLAALVTDEPTPLRELNPNVPEPLAALVHQLLAKKPDDRPQSAAEVAKRLRGLMDQLAGRAVAEAPTVRPKVEDISTSQPVVLDPKPHQPPLLAPMLISAAPANVFADLGAVEATEAELPATHRPAPQKNEVRTKTGLWIGAGVAVLLAAVTGIVLITKGNKEDKNGPVVEVKGSNGPRGEPNRKTVTPAPKVADPVNPTMPPGSVKNSIDMVFVKVPKGTGWLGGGGGKPGQTKVVFEQDNYMGRYEVSQEEWQKVTGITPSHFSRSGVGKEAVTDIPDADLKRFPVEMVSWDDCQSFVARLNMLEKDSGWVYRLPTEAEWEYACRGGPINLFESVYDFYTPKPSNTLLLEQANFAPVEGQGLQRTCKVGSYSANALGMFGMHGNVWEWCDDTEIAADGAMLRVVRGGGWWNLAVHCRTTY